MVIEILPQHWSCFLVIAIIVGALLAAYLKKVAVVFSLLFANVIIFIITLVYYYEVVYGFSAGLPYAGLGFRSIYLNVDQIPQLYTIFTSMFIHGGFGHILGNMLVLLFVGLPFEQRVGKKNFLIIYLVAGVCGTLAHSVLDLNSPVPLIGASGAIFGIMGAFAYSYPHDEIVMPIPLFVIMIFRRIKVMYAVLIFAAMETIIVFYESGIGEQSGTAHFAHIGGLIGGFILAAILIKNVKTHTKTGQTVYYDSDSPMKPKKINISNLRKLADTPELKDMLDKIEQETVPQVRDIWVEHFLGKTICPKCKNGLKYFDGKVWCEQCKFKTNY